MAESTTTAKKKRKDAHTQTMMFDRELWERVEREAEALGVSPTTWVRAACRKALRLKSALG